MMLAPSLQLAGVARICGTRIFGPLVLKAAAGRCICLLGPSGIGKSTVLQLLAGLDDNVTLDGAVTAGDGSSLAGRVALMAQSDLLMPWLTVLKNVLIGAWLGASRVSAI